MKSVFCILCGTFPSGISVRNVAESGARTKKSAKSGHSPGENPCYLPGIYGKITDITTSKAKGAHTNDLFICKRTGMPVSVSRRDPYRINMDRRT